MLDVEATEWEQPVLPRPALRSSTHDAYLEVYEQLEGLTLDLDDLD